MRGSNYAGSLRYVLAILVAAFALLLRHLLNPILAGHNPYHTAWLATILSAWYLGLGPSIFTTLLTAGGIWYQYLPGNLFAADHRVSLYGMIGYLILSSVIIALGESNRRASIAKFRLAAIVDSSEDPIISKTLGGIITSWNRAAERLFGWTEQEAVGQSITILIPPELYPEENEVLQRLRAGRHIEQFETVRVAKDGRRINVSLTISPIKDSLGQVIGASKIAYDITERKETEERLRKVHEELEERVKERTAELQEKNSELVQHTDVVRELSARLLKLQDDERRHIARELHDSVGQLLAGVSMNLAAIATEKEKLSPMADKCLEENMNLIEQLSREIRTMSHLLHPPLLDEVGLESAIRWYIDGYAQRSKIQVDLDMPSDFERLSNEFEISIFRVMQECLTNIHRHSGSAKAVIRLTREDGYVRLEIKDEGKGIPPEKKAAINSPAKMGVGFRGMRERMRQLGGTLEIDSDGNGTTVTATLPADVLSKRAQSN